MSFKIQSNSNQLLLTDKRVKCTFFMFAGLSYHDYGNNCQYKQNYRYYYAQRYLTVLLITLITALAWNLARDTLSIDPVLPLFLALTRMAGTTRRGRVGRTVLAHPIGYILISLTTRDIIDTVSVQIDVPWHACARRRLPTDRLCICLAWKALVEFLHIELRSVAWSLLLTCCGVGLWVKNRDETVVQAEALVVVEPHVVTFGTLALPYAAAFPRRGDVAIETDAVSLRPQVVGKGGDVCTETAGRNASRRV